MVRTPTPGQVQVSGLGLNAPTEPQTPARLPVFGESPGTHAIRFVPADGGNGTRIGLLRVVERAAD